MSKRPLLIAKEKLKKQLIQQEKDLAYDLDRVEKRRLRIEETKLLLDTLNEAIDQYRQGVEREVRGELRELKRENEQLQKLAGSRERTTASVNKADTDRAATLAFFDSLVFAIGNWSNDGQTAADCELACQSILFPAVYEQVMQSNSDYYITEVPSVALEIVRRGRQYVKHIRTSCDASLVDQGAWDDFAPVLQEWWINDALPLLYGARDPAWEEIQPLTLIEMTEWRDMPASRALHFPLIFDGMELVKKHGDEIREFTGLPEFNKQQVTTRLEP